MLLFIEKHKNRKGKDMSTKDEVNRPASRWRAKIHEIIFEAETPYGKAFDVILLWAIIFSVLSVILESVGAIRLEYGKLLIFLEWFFTVLFTFRIYTSTYFCSACS